MRVFIAIELNNDLRQEIHQIQKQFIETNCDIKWVKKENLHFTLKFIGEMDGNKLENIKPAIEKSLTDIKKFVVSIENLGTFPEGDNPRVMWVGVNEGKEELCSLSNIINEELAKIGYKKEKRLFTPHLTFGRVKSNRNIDKVMNKIKQVQNSHIGKAEVNQVIVMQSTLTPEGPIYTKLKVFNLCD